MKKSLAILFFLFISCTAFSQRTIKGRVVNSTTGASIPGSSVFITNTSKGTVSNNGGQFELNDVPAGKHELVISSIGYETNTFSFSDEQLPLQLKVELTIKVKELENVTLEPSVEEGWDKWGRTFMDNFVGNTENASKCRVKNEKSIKFRYYKKSNRLIAYCDEPVLLENKALGYIVSYQLENFEVNFKEQSMFFIGYSLFTPIEKGNEHKWEKKRIEAYNGSIMHFMRCLYTDRLLAEGFEVKRAVRTPNYEKQRVKAAYRSSMTTSQGGMNIITHGTKNIDSADYYRAVLRQPDYTEAWGAGLLSADSLLVEKGVDYRVIHFEDFLYVTYKNEKEEEGYLKAQMETRKPFFQRSYVMLLNEKLISLDKSGNYYSPQDFLTSAYWGWSDKMANSLPLDYEPPAKGR